MQFSKIIFFFYLKFVFFLIIPFIHNVAKAQTNGYCGIWWNTLDTTEYFVSLDPYTSTKTIINSIPGVKWINDGHIFDSDSNRYIFMGQDISNGPKYYYIIDVPTGNLIAKSPQITDYVNYIEYSTVNKAFYGLWWDAVNAIEYFVSLDPYTLTKTIINSIPEVKQINDASIFDPDSNRYILIGQDSSSGPKNYYIIDVLSGNLLSKSPFSAWTNYIEYTYRLPSNNLSGNVFQDINFNCTNDSSEVKIPNSLIRILPGTKLTTSDINGYYSFLLDTGSYIVEAIPPNSYWQQNCPVPPSYTVNFTNFYDSSPSNNFGYEIAIYCPLMSVDISTWALRPCMQSTYTVHYSNNGTIPADSAYIDIEFDNDITPISSTLNWSSQNGNIYTFNIGNIAPNQFGNFYITADVSCNAVLGSTHCIDAHIYPDSICTPVDTIWDKSSVSVEGICTNDSLACFTIYNNGDAMQGASSWRIYENNVLIETGTFQLAAGDSVVICRTANGNTIRLEADQHPGHPGNSHPNANVELCGGIFPSPLGFIIQVPEDDADEFIEMDCRQITGSYDPNEKLVKPAGMAQNHFIDSTDILEYQINFQNTGTDTAFKIVVRDTLSQNLDITSVQSGAGSHPYSFRIYGQGILEWTFNNILLPDSNTNETMSHGFVRFKVKQNEGNTIGTIIENRASIYFDYNVPVITNTAFNTVWKETTLSSAKIYEITAGVLIYPNPFSTSATFMVSGQTYNLTLKIYNLLGEEIKNFHISSSYFQFERDNLPSGIYIFKIFSSETLVGAGKLVAE